MSATAEHTALAGEFVLGLLDPAERRAVERRLATDSVLQAEILDWQRHFSVIDASAPPIQPSPGVWTRIEVGIREMRVPGVAAGAATNRGFRAWFWESLAIWRMIGVAGAFASLMLAGTLGVRIAQGPETPHLVAVLSAPDGRAAAIVNAYADGTVQLVPLDAIAAPEGRVLEVWTLQTRDRGPVSLARMDRARTMKLDLKGLSAAEVGHLFEITIEPQGGSPTGKPTGPVLMKGLAATRL